jgi:hypothetical protein
VKLEEDFMSLPKSYMTSTKRVPEILEAIQSAQAPSTFTTRFLEQLGFKNKGDRLIIGVLKDLGFLDEKGVPKDRYYRFLDQTHSGIVLAEGIREAWADLFAINVNAHQLSKAEFIGKLKTLSQGQLSDAVMDFHYSTFSALVKNADFTSHIAKPLKTEEKDEKKVERKETNSKSELQLGGLVYNIQIVLPESRDPAVYDALFKSLKDHLV